MALFKYQTYIDTINIERKVYDNIGICPCEDATSKEMQVIMKEQIGIPANLPFQEINKICDLIYFEGPILSHFKDENGQDYFSYWVDEDEKGYRWLIFKVEEYDIYLFLTQQVDLKRLMLKDTMVYLSTIDDDFSDILRVKSKKLRLDYFPERNYYYKYEIPNVYGEMISNIM